MADQRIAVITSFANDGKDLRITIRGDEVLRLRDISAGLDELAKWLIGLMEKSRSQGKDPT